MFELCVRRGGSRKEKMEKAMTVRNPLQIPEVLEKVFGYLPLKDLKSSRLVNKQWNVWALPAMKKIPNATVNFENIAGLLSCLRNIPGGTSNFPCSKFKFKNGLIPYYYNKGNWINSVTKAAEVFSDFLLTISSWVTELTWESALSEQKEILWTVVFLPKTEFPNLKILRLANERKDQPTHVALRNFNLLVTSILEKAPSMKKLSWERCTGGIHNLVNLLPIVETKISFFTELELNEISNSDLERLSRWKRELKLKSLSLTFLRSQLNKTSLFQLLSAHYASLEELKLDFGGIPYSLYNGIPTVVTFPEMPNLKTLSIHLRAGYKDDKPVLFSEISYKRQFPVLKTLYFKQFSLQFVNVLQPLLNSGMAPVDTIQELTLPSSRIWDFPLLSVLEAGIFPNVKKLGVGANPEALRSVFNHLRDLEELTLDCSQTPDSIDFMLTGLKELEVATIKERIEREGNAFQWNQLELGNVNDSIAALQKLRVLRFKRRFYDRSLELEVSRVSLQLILSGIQSLKCIDFGARKYPMDTKIDRAWWEELNKDCVLLWTEI